MVKARGRFWPRGEARVEERRVGEASMSPRDSWPRGGTWLDRVGVPGGVRKGAWGVLGAARYGAGRGAGVALSNLAFARFASAAAFVLSFLASVLDLIPLSVVRARELACASKSV